MSRETTFIAFLALLCALALDWAFDTHVYALLFIVGVAIWGLVTAISLSYQLEALEKAYRAKFRQLAKELNEATTNTE